jgi:lysyl-tRNA synthetase class 1
MTIPDLFDEYDRCWQSYISGKDENQARAFELSQIKEIPDKEEIFLPRFRDVANFLNLGEKDLVKKFEEIKNGKLTEKEKIILGEREKYAAIWLKEYAPEDFQMGMSEEIPDEVKSLDNEQREYLKKVITLFDKEMDTDKLQIALYNLAKESKTDIKKAFAAIYVSFIGKDHGPKAGIFLSQYPKEKVIERLREVSNK